LKKIGVVGEFSKVLLRMTYASTKKELDKLKRTAEAIAERDITMLASEKYKKLVNSCSKSAFISLRIFTGGTVTNSFSESVNSLLRRAGLNTKYSMLNVLRYLENFTEQQNCEKQYQFPSSFEYLPVLDSEVVDKVTVGTLCHLKKKVQNTVRNCELVMRGDQAFVREAVKIRYCERVHLVRICSFMLV